MAAIIPLSHQTVKVPGQKVFAVADWNANHHITADIDISPYNITATGFKDSSLRGHYQFVSDATDSSIYGNDATAETGNPDYSTNVVDLDGNDGIDLVASNVLFPNNNSWTQSFWFQSDEGDSIAESKHILTGARDAAGGTGATIIRLHNTIPDSLSFAYRDGDNNFNEFDGPTVASLSSGWHHVVVTYDGTTFIMYVDGVVEVTQVDNFYGFGSEVVYVGYDTFAGDSNFFNGRMDDLMFYDRHLTPAEILNLYSIQSKNYGYFNDVIITNNIIVSDAIRTTSSSINIGSESTDRNVVISKLMADAMVFDYGNNTFTFYSDLFFSGAGSGLPYGYCYSNHMNWTQANAAQNTWYPIGNGTDTNMISGALNNCTHNAGLITVAKAGTYKVDFDVSYEINAANVHMEVGIEVNGADPAADSPLCHTTSKFANQEQGNSGTGIIVLIAGQTIQVSIRTTDVGTPNFKVDNVHLNCVMVGG